MIELDDRVIVPIGCSCINQFQIGYRYGTQRCRGSLFQWTVATPDTSAQMLECAARGELVDFFRAPSDFEMDGAHMRNRHFGGFYHWHEDAAAVLGGDVQAFDGFTRKIGHLADNMVSASKPVWFLWSNIQPNLRAEIEDKTRLSWDDFRLTGSRRTALRHAALRLHANARFVFVAREADIDAELHDDPEVVLMALPRSDKFRGAKDLFSGIFDKIQGA